MTAINLTACSTCNGATAHTIGGKKCDNCWQVEHRIDKYLRVGGSKARQFLADSLLAEVDRIEGLRR